MSEKKKSAKTAEPSAEAVVAQLTGAGGQRIDYFRQLAALLGLSIRVTEYRPFLAGLSRCGDQLNGDHDVRFVWSVVVRGQRVLRFRCGASVPGERLLDFARRLSELLPPDIRLKKIRLYETATSFTDWEND